MNEREIAILIAISKALPEMTEFEKGRFLGVAEGMVLNKEKEEKENKKEVC